MSESGLDTTLHTPLCDLLGCRYPIVQTAMGWVAGAELVAATCNAGAFGVLAGATTAAVAARAHCDVVVVPSFWTDDHSRGRVVVGVKTHSQGMEMLGSAFAEAAARGTMQLGDADRCTPTRGEFPGRLPTMPMTCPPDPLRLQTVRHDGRPSQPRRRSNQLGPKSRRVSTDRLSIGLCATATTASSS